jgi:hypothetical protein
VIRWSHKDYWNGKQKILKALQAGCNCFEVDIIYSGGDIRLSHSWRPFGLFTYGKLKDYVRRLSLLCEENPRNTFYLYIEFKSGNQKIKNKLYFILRKYKADNLIVLVDSIHKKWYHAKRYKLMIDFLTSFWHELDLNKFDRFLLSLRPEEYEKVKLYDKKWWMI